MYGATRDDAESLVPLGRSWLFPPKLTVLQENIIAQYDLTQKCYVISGLEKRTGKKLQFILEAKPDSPIINPAFLVENWGNREAKIMVNDKIIPRGKSFRYGHIRRVNRYDLVVWLQLDTKLDTEIIIQPAEGK
jgi:hypothetical protein